jgi:hypothetical protein
MQSLSLFGVTSAVDDFYFAERAPYIGRYYPCSRVLFTPHKIKDFLGHPHGILAKSGRCTIFRIVKLVTVKHLML